jgi:hypothetical protein
MATRSGQRFSCVISALFVILLTALQICLLVIFPAASRQNQPAARPSSEEASFAGSRLIPAKDMVREGETIVYALIVRYDGAEIRKEITVQFHIPDPSLLVSSSPPMVLGEEDNRELTWRGEISPSQEMKFIITLMAMPHTSSSRLMLASAGISWRRKGMEWQVDSHWLQSETEIHSKLTPILYVLPNGMAIGKAEIVLLGYLVLTPMLTILISTIIMRREKRHPAIQLESKKAENRIQKLFLYAMSFAFVCSLGVLHLICFIAVEDFRRFVAYEEVTCILLDKRIVLDERSSFSRGAGPGRLNSTTVYHEPMVAVRYFVGSREIISAGAPRPTTMLSPVDKYALRELAQYERGHSYPCWYDPQRPEIFVLARGISLGWYLLATGPMILLYFLGRHLLRRMRK